MVARLRLLTAGMVVAVLLPASVAVAQDRGDLDEARQRIAELSAELEEAADKRESAELELDEAKERLEQVEAVVNQVAQRVELERQGVNRAAGEVERSEKDLERARETLRRRAIQWYMSGHRGESLGMFAAADIETIIATDEVMTLTDVGDQAVLDNLVRAGRQAASAKEVLRAREEAFSELLAEQEVLLEEAEELRESRALAAAAAAEEEEEAEENHDDAVAAADAMERAILAAEQEAAERAAAARAAASDNSSSDDSGDTDEGGDDGDDDDDGGDPPPPPPPTGSGYIYPACGLVTSEYGWRWGRLHAGLDIDDTSSSSIVAANSGTVISAGWNSGGYGNLTLIDHGDGIVTAYAHQAAMYVSSGQSVSRGQSIGVIGTTGNSTGTHLHFETRVNGSAVNPRGVVSGGC